MSGTQHLSFWRAFLATLLIGALLAAAFLAGAFWQARQQSGLELPVLEQARQLLLTRGLHDAPPDPALEYGMIRGMLQSYNDPYTVFVEPPQHELEGDTLEGKFGGVGVTLSQNEAGGWVLHPLPDSPAQQAGLQDGDLLLGVDELSIDAATPLDLIQAAVRGPVGASVTLLVGRGAPLETLQIPIRRAEIALPSVTWYIAPDHSQVGVIKVNLIAASTADEIQQAVQALRNQGAERFVLDLRDNPGGLLDAGVEIARLFLKEGIVMEEQYRGKEKQTYRVETPGALADLPLIVLINQGSASAAEIAAGALQANRRAELVGAPSYGKDTIQLIFDLLDGSSLHVSAARWWTPGLPAPIAGVGLQPDLPVEIDPAQGGDPILQTAIQRLLQAP